MPKVSLSARVAALRAALTMALCATLTLAASAPALAAVGARAHANGEDTPLNLGADAGKPVHVGGGGNIVRTIVGLAIVIGVIYGVTWVLRQMRKGREEYATGAGLAAVASVPLGPRGSVHLVRAGRDYVLVGVGDHGVTPIRTYMEHEARAAGLIDEHGELIGAAEEAALVPARRTRGAGLSGAGFDLRAWVDAIREWTVRR